MACVERQDVDVGNTFLGTLLPLRLSKSPSTWIADRKLQQTRSRKCVPLKLGITLALRKHSQGSCRTQGRHQDFSACGSLAG
jgi:hypothetical protein